MESESNILCFWALGRKYSFIFFGGSAPTFTDHQCTVWIDTTIKWNTNYLLHQVIIPKRPHLHKCYPLTQGGFLMNEKHIVPFHKIQESEKKHLLFRTQGKLAPWHLASQQDPRRQGEKVRRGWFRFHRVFDWLILVFWDSWRQGWPRRPPLPHWTLLLLFQCVSPRRSSLELRCMTGF